MIDSQLLSGRVAVVTGGAAGIGGGVSRRFADAGARVVLNDIDGDLAAATVSQIEAAGGSAVAVVGDILEKGTVAALLERALEVGEGRVDVLVNNVGDSRAVPGQTPAIKRWSETFLSTTEEQWERIYRINLHHVFRCTQTFLPIMIEQGSGSIVNVATVEGIRGFPRKPVYAAFNAGVIQFTRSVAVDVARHGVRVNAIAPDLGDTPQTPFSTMLADYDRATTRLWAPLGRFGSPDDYADVILFLASDQSRYVVGQTIPVDGGTTAAGGWYQRADGSGWTNFPERP